MLGEGLAAWLEFLGSGGGKGGLSRQPQRLRHELAASQGCSAGSLAGPSFPQGLINQKKRKHTVKGRKHQQTKEGRAH